MNPSYQHYATHDESEYPELWEGCVGAWAPCLGPSATRLHDNSGKANWGTLTNMDAATDWVVDGGRYALDFDGSNDYVEIPSNNAINVPGAMTVSAWFNLNGNPVDNQGIVAKWRTATPPNGRQYAIGIGTGRLLFAGISSDGTFQAGNFITSPSAVAINVWNHAVMVFTPGVSINLYVNGVLSVTTSTLSTSVFEGTAPLAIGHQANLGLPNLYFNGRIDDVMIWRRSLRSSEQFSLYSLGRGGMYQPRRRRKAYFGQQFNAAWARGANQFIQPSMIGVA